MFQYPLYRTRTAFVIWLTINGHTRWFQICSWREKASHWLGSQNQAIWEPVEFVS